MKLDSFELRMNKQEKICGVLKSVFSVYKLQSEYQVEESECN